MVSGKRSVEKIPVNMKKAKICIMCLRNLPVPPMLINRAKPT